MLLYITAEDVLGERLPERKGPRAPREAAQTLSALFDLAMRHHDRSAAMLWPTASGFEAVPDWKLDRLVIRLALYCRERLGLKPQGCLAVVGELSWLSPAIDFAAAGLGARSLGVEPGVEDRELADVLAAERPSAVFAADGASAERLLRMRVAGAVPGTLVVPDEVPALCAAGPDGIPAPGDASAPRGMPAPNGTPAASDGVLRLGRLLELAAVLDTAERAQSFRAAARGVSPDAAALLHLGPNGRMRLSHREAMASVAAALSVRPAQAGDVAYLDSGPATLAARLAVAAFVGDGLTTTALGRSGRTAEDVAEVRPHKMLVSRAWLESACEGLGPRWPAGLDRQRVRRRARERLGGRLRSVATDAAPSSGAARALAAAGIDLVRGEAAQRAPVS